MGMEQGRPFWFISAGLKALGANPGRRTYSIIQIRVRNERFR
jgi:hypothetical protein